MLQCKRLREKVRKQERKTQRRTKVMQQMSANVSGKQQKYTRIGAQEYVPFEHEEITSADINDACIMHFRPQIEKDLTCDMLTRDHMPSCEKMAHIPNLKLFYVWLIKA